MLPPTYMRTILLACVLVAAGTGCGVETDDRPVDAEYIVTAITKPACGNAACHSSASGRKGIILDTVEGLCGYGYISGRLRGGGRKRMPLDSPLPEADIQLIERWEQVQMDTGVFPGCP